MTALFWAVLLTVALVLTGLLWAAIIRRDVRRQVDAIRTRGGLLEEYYRELFENAHDILFKHDLDGNLMWLNKAGRETLGYGPEEAGRLNLIHLLAPGRQEAFRDMLQHFRDGLTNGHCELDLRPQQGRRVVLRANLRQQSLPGKAPQIQGIAWDITEREEAEEALRESENRLRQSLEERTRIGRDLHDGIIQSIYAIGLGLGEARRLLKTDVAAAEVRLSQGISDLNQVIREVRSFIVGLEPKALKGKEFQRSLESLVRARGETAAAQVSISVDPQAADRLSPQQASHLLQIAREALSNSLRHGRARRTGVTLDLNRDCVRLEVRDDGVGFDPAKANGPGLGLRNILARAQDIGARSELFSAPGQGTTVRVALPAS
jgi:PAS domain S-box-containing protein